MTCIVNNIMVDEEDSRTHWPSKFKFTFRWCELQELGSLNLAQCKSKPAGLQKYSRHKPEGGGATLYAFKNRTVQTKGRACGESEISW